MNDPPDAAAVGNAPPIPRTVPTPPNPDPPSSASAAFRAVRVRQGSAFRWLLNQIRRRRDSSPTVPPSEPPSPAPESVPEAPESEPIPPACGEAPPTTGPPRFESRVFWTPKRGNSEAEWEDGYMLDPAAGLLAVADGAGAGIFSKLWADLLLNSYRDRPIPLDDPQAVHDWILQQRRAWFLQVDPPRQRWSVQLRLEQTCGAATFLALQLGPTPEPAGFPVPWQAGAVGDICLFHVREGCLQDHFPIAHSADFGTTPPIFQSRALGPMPGGLTRQGELQPGDFLLIATDALAQTLLTDVESGQPPDWSRFWDQTPDDWRLDIEARRDAGTIINDDCTLVVVRLPSLPSVATEEADPSAQDDPGAPLLEIQDESVDESNGIR